MKQRFSFKLVSVVLTAALLLSAMVFAPVSASQIQGDQLFGYISEYKEFQQSHQGAIDKLARGMWNLETNISIREFAIPKEDIEMMFTVLMNTHPELFYVSRSYRYYTVKINGTSCVSRVTPVWGRLLYNEDGSYSGQEETFTDSQVMQMRSEFRNRAQWYLDKVDDSMSDFKKALILHDELILNSSYLLTGETYDLMVNGYGKCYGYSEAYSYLLEQVGIKSEIIESDPMFHQWNKVEIDGKYYHVDVTWDDPVPDQIGFADHRYFMLSDSAIENLPKPHYEYTSSIPSNDTRFDNMGFHKINTQHCFVGNTCYVVDNNRKSNSRYGKSLLTYNPDTDRFSTLHSFEHEYWEVDDEYVYADMYMSLQEQDAYLYMNTEQKVLVYDTRTGVMSDFARNNFGKPFYGVRVIDKKVYAVLGESPFDENKTLRYVGDCFVREEPTTEEPTTEEPTTEEPTTEEPTTEEPTTEEPTTEEPTTEEPTTEEPTTAPPVFENGYYLIGPDWDLNSVDLSNRFEFNNAFGMYYLSTHINEGERLKVVKIENDQLVSWYPDGYGNEYVVEPQYAGDTTIYFSTSNNEAWSHFGGHMYLPVTVIPTTEAPTTEEPTTEEPTTEEPTTEEPTTEEPTTEPQPEDVYIVAGSLLEVFHEVWDGECEANIMSCENGVYTKTYTVDKAIRNIQLKVVKNNDVWYGGDDGNNIMFSVTAPGTFTVTFDPVTEKITVTGDNVINESVIIIYSVYASGNGEGHWMHGADWDTSYPGNRMNQVADGVWEISFDSITEAADRQLKFAINGEWAHCFGGTFIGSGVETDAVYDGSNITFNTGYELQTVKLQLDLRGFDYTTKVGAKFIVTIEDTTPEPTTEEPTTEDPTTEEPTTEEPTTEEPTTEEPTTEEPTTEEPTTEEPTTEVITTAPRPEDVYVVAGSPVSVFQSEWDGTCEANRMTKDGDVYVKSYTVDRAMPNIQLKIVKNNRIWYGDEIGKNVKFRINSPGTFTVTFDPATEEVSVTGDDVVVEPVSYLDAVNVVGNGEGAWLNNADWNIDFNRMRLVADNIWETTFENVTEAFDRQFLFATDGSMQHSFGGAFVDSGVETDAVYDGNTITFDTEYELQTVNIRLDLRGYDEWSKTGAKYTVTITPREVPTTEEPTTEEPTTEEPTTEEPTTEEPTTEEPTTETQPEDTYIVAGSKATIFQNEWDGACEANRMVKDGDIYVKTYTVDRGYTEVQLKVVKNNSEWYGMPRGRSVTFDIDSPGTFTVYFDPATGEVWVSGEDVHYYSQPWLEYVNVMGNGDGAWLKNSNWDPAANRMTEVADDVWEISFDNVEEAFDRQFQFALNGSMTLFFGGTFVNSGVVTDAVFGGGKITFDTEYEYQTVKIQLDLRRLDEQTRTGATFTVTIIPFEEPTDEPTTAEPTTVEPTTAEPTTVEPTTEEPTTEEPSTAEPTTAEPPTEEPTTAEPPTLQPVTEPPVIIGDVDCDGEITINDATFIQTILAEYIDISTLNWMQRNAADTNRDGKISVRDVTEIQRHLAELITLPLY